MIETLTLIAFGFSLVGAVLGLLHGSYFVKRTAETAYMPRRESLDWRVVIVLTAWFAATAIFTWVLYLWSLMIGRVFLMGEISTVLVTAACLVSLLSAEVYCVQYLPGIGLARRIAELEAQQGPVGQGEADERGLLRFLRACLAVVWRTVLRLLTFRWVERPRSRPIWSFRGRMQIADALLFVVWGVGIWGVLIVAATRLLSSEVVLSIHFVTLFGSVLVVLPPVLLFLNHFDGDFEREILMGYVPKQYAHRGGNLFLVPEGHRSRTSETMGIQRLAFYRGLRARAAILLALLFAVMTSYVSFAASFVGFDAVIHLERTRYVAVALVGTVILALLLALFQYQRRLINIWEDVGIAQANRLSQLFMRETGHQLKNLMGPIEFGLDRAAELGEDCAKGAPVDPEFRDMVVRRVSAGRRNVDRVRGWLQRLREDARSADDKRKRWLEPGRDRWVPLDEVISRILESAANMANEAMRDGAPPTTLSFFVKDGDRIVDPPVDFRFIREQKEVVVEPQGLGGSSVSSRFIRIDDETLYDIMQNITRNALEAVQGSVERSRDAAVDFRVHIREGGRFPIAFSVRDNGPGIKPDLRDSIFEPAVTTKDGGMGMGLFMAKEYLHVIEGAIHFTTSSDAKEAEPFTTFLVRLPASRYRSDGAPVDDPK